MHGSIHRQDKINNVIGKLTFLFGVANQLCCEDNCILNTGLFSGQPLFEVSDFYIPGIN